MKETSENIPKDLKKGRRGNWYSIIIYIIHIAREYFVVVVWKYSNKILSYDNTDQVAASIDKSKLLASRCNRQLAMSYYEKGMFDVVVTVPSQGTIIRS